MQKINEIKSVDTLSRGTAEIVIIIYFFQIGSVLFSLLFGNSGVYGLIFKIILFVEIECVPPDFQYAILGLHLLLIPITILYPRFVIVLKLYPYILSLPFFVDSLDSFNINNPGLSAICLANMLLNLLLMRISYLLYMSYSFISSKDFLADRTLWWVKIAFPYGLVIARYFNLALIGGIASFVCSIMVLVKEMFEFNYVVKHEGYIQMSAMIIFSTLIWFSYYFSNSNQAFGTLSLIFVLGLFASRLIAREIILFVRHQAVYNPDFKTFKKCEDTVRFMFEVKRQYIEEKQNRKKYYGILANHLQSCLDPECKCKVLDLSKSESVHGFYNQLLIEVLSTPTDNLTEQRIVMIYYFMQIICQPLRAFFEATKLTKEKLSLLNKIQVTLIVQEARLKVDILLGQHKACNQDLELIKIEKFQKLLAHLKEKFNQILKELIKFLEFFCSKNMSIRRLQKCAMDLDIKRDQINGIIDELNKINPNSKQLISMIKLYFQYFDLYDSKVSKYEKLRHDFTMEQRLFHSDQKIMFDDDHGVITIDLAENLGKVQYVSSRVAEMFRLKSDQMIGTNISTYMPSDHGAQHSLILKNFIQKGSVNVLNKLNVFFGLNQSGFIFPMQLKIKIQTYTAESFRSTALVRNLHSKYEYILTSPQGICLDVSQNFYKSVFFPLFEDDINKMKRFNLKSIMLDLHRGDLEYGVTYSGYIAVPEVYVEKADKLTESNQMVPVVSGRSNSGLINNSTFSNSQSKNDLIKWIDSTNFRKLNCFKVKFKLSQIKSSYFITNTIEIQSFKEQFKDAYFYKKMFNWLAKLCEAMHLEDYRLKMVTAKRAVQGFTTHEELQMLDGVNVDFGQIVPIVEQESNSIETETVEEQSMESQKSGNKSNRSEKILADSAAQDSQKSSVSSVDYTFNKKQLVVDGFKQSDNSDYVPIRRMIYIFIGFVILLKMIDLGQNLIFSSFTKNQDISNSYLQRITRAFYYYSAFKEISVMFSNDTNLYPMFQSQLKIQETLFMEEVKNNQKLSEQQRWIFGFEPVLTATNIKSTQPSISTLYLNFVQIINQISVEASTMIIAPSFYTHFIKQNLIELIKIFESLKLSYYTLKLKTIQAKQNFSLNFTLGCEIVYLIFFAISIPLYMFYNRKKLQLLNFMAFFSYRTIKTEVRFFRNMESKMFQPSQTLEDGSYYEDYALSLPNETFARISLQSKQNNTDSFRDQNASLMFSDIKDTKNGFILLVIGFFILYSILNWSIWILAHSYDEQSKASLNTQINFNSLGTQTPLVLYSFISNMNNLKRNQPVNEQLFKIFNQSVYYDLLESQFRRSPKTQYVNNTVQMLISGYCRGCAGILSKGYFDNAKSIYKKFWYFVQSNYSTFTRSNLQSWIQSQDLTQISVNLIRLRDWVLQLYDQLDVTINTGYTQYWTLIALFIIGNSILTGALGYFMEKVYINEICVMINKTESLFKNLSVSVISGNLPLLTYFGEKLRKR